MRISPDTSMTLIYFGFMGISCLTASKAIVKGIEYFGTSQSNLTKLFDQYQHKQCKENGINIETPIYEIAKDANAGLIAECINLYGSYDKEKDNLNTFKDFNKLINYSIVACFSLLSLGIISLEDFALIKKGKKITIKFSQNIYDYLKENSNFQLNNISRDNNISSNNEDIAELYKSITNESIQ